jgi:hypothetical protein
MLTRILGLVAVAGLLLVAVPAERAQAVSLANPATAASAKDASETLGMTTDVHWRHYHWRHYHWRRHHWHRHHGWRHHRWHRRHYRYY